MKTLILLLIGAGFYLLARTREQRKAPTAAAPKDGLDAPLSYWSDHDPFTMRDLVRSVSIMGSTGSGKTSGPGYQLGKALAANPRVGGLIIASKPEDRAMWQGIIGDRLIIVGPDGKHRFNVLDFEAKNGADAREITQCIMTISETLLRAEGHSNDPFWTQQQRRTIHNAAEIVNQANRRVTPWSIQGFINEAALSGEELESEKWKASYHKEMLDKAAPQNEVEEHDYKLAKQFWLTEWPYMADKTRSSILAGVMGYLHVFNTGGVRKMIGMDTTLTPAIFDEGAWVLVDFPVANYGVAGAFIAGAWIYATQRHVLRRAARAETPVTCLWIDEFQNHITSFFARYLAECRSHLGCAIVLTQSMHSFFSSIGGREAQSHTKALLANFGHKIFMALGDDESAQYAASLIGKGILHMGGSSIKRNDPNGGAFGSPQVDFSLSERIEQVLQNGAFLHGLKTGGPENGYIAEGFVIRNGNLFSNGFNFMRVAFSQK